MKICYCADEKVLPILRRSAETVLKFNPDAEIFVISKNRLDIPYKNILIDTGKYNFILNENDRLTEATYYRIFLPTLGFDKCLYLDCDTLCAGSLKELWEMDIPYIGLCHSHESGIIQAKLLHIPRYGSDAVMLMNCEALRRIHFTETMLRVLPNLYRAPGGFHAAETLLNAVFFDRLTFIPLKWNKCKNRSYRACREKEIHFADAVIRHYIGGQVKEQISDYKKLMQVGK